MKQALALVWGVWGISALTLEQRPPTSAGLLAQEDAHASSLLEVADAGTQGRQERVESMLSAEQSALLSQEQALEQIAAQQASLAQQQQSLKEREAKVEDEIAQKIAHLDASLTQVASQSSVGVGLEALKRWHLQSMNEQLIPSLCYLAVLVVGGIFYGRYFTYTYASLRKEPRFTKNDFSFGLFDGFSCDPDLRIFCCSCFFLPIRWADTASSPKIQFLGFWPGLLLMGILLSVVNLTYGASLLAVLTLAVLNRQRIRNLYGLPNRSCGTCTNDVASWLFCAPCAAMQEALQVEFVDSYLDATVPQQMQMNSMDAFLTAPATTGDLPGAFAAGQRKANQSCC